MSLKFKQKVAPELTHDDLVELGSQWLRSPHTMHIDGRSHRFAACPIIATEITTAVRETPDVIGWSGRFSVVIEAKATRSDFVADAKKYFRREAEYGMGSYRYFLAPKGVICEHELPAGWGLLEVGDSAQSGKAGRKIRAVAHSQHFVAHKANETVVLQSLLRRMKVEPGKHVKIRVYTIESSVEPRATVTIKSEDTGEEIPVDERTGKQDG